MKTTNRTSILVASLCALALSLGSAAYAEKGAEALVRRTNATAPANAEAAALPADTCAMCTDSLVSVVDKSTKGPNFAVTKVVRHNCPACETTLSVQGTGKAAREVATHTCGGEVNAACCASK